MSKLKMKFLSPAVALLICTNIYADNLTYSIEQQSLKDAIEIISKKAKIPYIVKGNLLEGKKSKKVNNITGSKNALKEVLEGTNLEAVIEDGAILIRKKKPKNDNSSQNSLGEVDILAHSNDGLASQGYLVKEVKGVGPWGTKSLQNTPYSINTISGSLIENIVASDMDQIYKMNPLTQTSAPMTTYGTPYAAFRGFHIWSSILDGMKLDKTTGLTLEDIDRIEILNGLSGFMYGSGNVGGTTHYILKKPTYERLTNLTLGNKGGSQYFAHLDLGNIIDEEGKFAYRLNISQQDGETSVEGQNVEKRLISGVLDWNISDNFLAQLSLAHNYYRVDKKDSRFYGYADSDWNSLGYWFDAFPNDKTYTPDWTFIDTKTNRLGLNVKWDINEDLRLRAGYMYKKDVTEDSWSYATYFGGSGWQAKWNSHDAPQDTILNAYNTYLDYDFNTAGIKHHLTVGISTDTTTLDEYENGRVSGDDSPAYDSINGISSYLATDLVLGDLGKKYKSSEFINTNILIGDDITFNEQFSALVGFNYSTIEDNSFDSSGAKDGYEESALTPTLSILYKPFEELTTYVSYMEALEKGEEVGSDSAYYNNPGEILDPYVSKQYELGLKYSLGENLLLSSALFRIEKANSFERQDSNGKFTVTQDGLEVHQGLELTLTGKMTDDLTIMAGGTILDPKIEKSTYPEDEGKKPTGTASMMANIYAEYNIPSMRNLTLTGGAYHTGKTFKDYENKIEIPSYTIFDLGARYKTKIGKYPTTFNLNIANLTGEDHWASSYTLGVPRNVAFSMKMKF